MTYRSHLVTALALLAVSGTARAQQTALENGVLAEINRARGNPQSYVDQLRAYRALIGPDRVRHEPGDPTGIVTFEGTTSVDDATAALEHLKPLPPLASDGELVKVARAYAAEQGRTGGVGHVSADGTTMTTRIRKHRMVYGAIAETISYGEHTAADVVRQLVIDDGVPGRGHRKILFAPGLSYAGVGCAAHVRYRIECVEDFSSTPVPPEAAPQN